MFVYILYSQVWHVDAGPHVPLPEGWCCFQSYISKAVKLIIITTNMTTTTVTITTSFCEASVHEL